jgi:serine/threonine protein kinase
VADNLDPDNLPAGTQVGFYRIVRRIGAGGFATLYEVDRDGKPYALKLARERLGAKSAAERARFQNRSDREVASLKSLNHPNIVKVHALDRWPDLETGHPYLVMDLVRGAELREWCTARPQTPLAIAALFEKLARAVHHMHLAEVIHRDLKSENVLVRDDGDPVVIDFGIARARSSFRFTQHVALVGTPSHYAPEYLKHRETEAWARGEEFEWTPSTDLYAVGYMFYEVLSGHPPFEDHDDDVRLWKSIQEQEPAAPSELNAAVPPELDVVVMRLLAKDPLHRHDTALELADELRVLCEAHQRDLAWTAPLASPSIEPAPRSAHDDGRTSQLERIDDLAAQGAAMAARAEAAGATPRRSSGTASEGEAADISSGALRALREKAEAAAGERRRVPRPLLLAAAATLLIGTVVVAASRGSPPQRPTSLMAKASLSTVPIATDAPPSPARTQTERLGTLSSAPSAADARAIDRELEARFGGRPTVTPDGAIVNVPVSPLAPEAPPPGRPELRAAGKAQDSASADPGRRGITPPTDEPAWLKRTSRPDTPAAASATAKPLGVATGSRIAARLVTSLDSRTVGSGPVEARVTRPFMVRGSIVLPAGTLVFGRAAAIEGRFVVRFDRLRLPDDREVEFAALAMDRDDHRPGLPATRRIAGERQQEPEGLGSAIARSSAGTVLNTVTGGLGSDLVRDAGHVALQRRDSGSAATRDTQILDPGLVFDVWVERPF